MNRQLLLTALMTVWICPGVFAQRELPEPAKRESEDRQVVKRRQIQFVRVHLDPASARRIKSISGEFTVRIIDRNGKPVRSQSINRPWQWNVITHEGLYLKAPSLMIAPGAWRVQLLDSDHGNPTGRELPAGIQLSVAGINALWQTEVSEDPNDVVPSSWSSETWPIPATPVFKLEKAPAPVPTDNQSSTPSDDVSEQTTDARTEAGNQSTTPSANQSRSQNTGLSPQEILESFDGEWQVLRMVVSGRKEDEKWARFAGRQLEVGRPGEQETFVVTRIDPTKSPAQIDFRMEQSPIAFNGIYDWDVQKSKLTICLGSGKFMDYPNDYVSGLGSGRILIELIRLQP